MIDIIIFLVFSGSFVALSLFWGKQKQHDDYTGIVPSPRAGSADVIYAGLQDSIPFQEIHDILCKHCHYFIALDPGLKKAFVERLLDFMREKIFIIKDDEAFKEMPVLVSAAAIRLSFGLKDYLLPFYKYIRIHPQEYIADDSFKILAGNVQNNTITVAWNHLLHGNAHPTDGSNLGLHELSHALYLQKLIIGPNQARRFVKQYNYLITECREAWQNETTGKKDLYSAYAESDIQEFWAESVEIFFEKPEELQLQYPAVYEAMKLLLNQDPRNREFPILKPGVSFRDRVYAFLSRDKA